MWLFLLGQIKKGMLHRINMMRCSILYQKLGKFYYYYYFAPCEFFTEFWMTVWVSVMVKGKAVLPFDIWLHYEVILFYPTLASWCNSLNKKGSKESYERRQQQIGDKDVSFIFFLYFLGSTIIPWVREFSLNTIEMVESPS